MSFEIVSTLDSGMGGEPTIIDPETLASFSKILDEELYKELAVPAAKAESTAKRVHKYTKRTGLLEHSTNVKVRKDVGSDNITTRVEGYIDGVADYAEDIISGKGRKGADPFLENAIRNTGPEFEQAINRALDRAADRLIKGL